MKLDWLEMSLFALALLFGAVAWYQVIKPIVDFVK